MFLGTVVSVTWSLVYRYRRVSSAEQRRQTRWVVFGVALAIAGSFPFQLPVDLQLIGGDTPFVLLLFNIGFTSSFLLIPLSVGVAVVSSHLFDIDVLINRTLVYGALTVMLALVYFGGVVGLQRLLSPIVGESNQLATVASTLAIAALFNPLRYRVQAFVDRRFYRKKYDARKTLEALLRKAQRRDGPRRIERRFGGGGQRNDATGARLVVASSRDGPRRAGRLAVVMYTAACEVIV